MANLKNIVDLPVAESAEGLNLIVNDNGAAKQIAASAVGAQADWAETNENSPAFVKNKPKSVLPDWNQNDPSAPDYVKNRTHYSEMVEEVLVNETITEFYHEDGMLFYEGEFDTECELVHGETYTVIFNGVSYAYVFDGEDRGYMGNPAIMDDGDDTGEPFAVHGGCVFTKTNEPCTVKITQMVENVVAIPEKYLPPEDYDLVISLEEGNVVGSVSEIFNKLSTNKPVKIAVVKQVESGSLSYYSVYNPVTASLNSSAGYFILYWIESVYINNLDSILLYSIRVWSDGSMNEYTWRPLQ